MSQTGLVWQSLAQNPRYTVMTRTTHILILCWIAPLWVATDTADAAPIFFSLDLNADGIVQSAPAPWSPSTASASSQDKVEADQNSEAPDLEHRRPHLGVADSAGNTGMSSQLTTSSSVGPASLPVSAPVCFSANSIPFVIGETLQLPPPLANRLFRPPRHAS